MTQASQWCTSMNDHGQGYQFRMLSRPLTTSSSDELTSTAMLSRSRPCATERTGGHWNSFGATDQSFTSSSGIDAMPVMTCTPWVSR